MTLEKIINKVKDAGKSAINFCKDNAKSIGYATAMAGMIYGGTEAKAVDPASPGYLKIKNCLNSKTSSISIRRDDGNFSGATDGYDIGLDGSALPKQAGNPNCYSEIIDGKLYHLVTEFKSETSNTPYEIKLSFQGTLPTNKPTSLEISMPLDGLTLGEYHFGKKPVIFESNDLPYGNVFDVKRAIATQNNGTLDSNGIAIIPLTDVPAGPYDQWIPYASGTLTIGTRILSDLNEDGKVNMQDSSILAEDWMKSQGKYIGDISGPNGIPDGFVDGYDLSAFGDDWLKDINDQSTW